VFEAEARFKHSAALHRQKREWIVPPQILEENIDYTKRDFIAKVSEPLPAVICLRKHYCVIDVQAKKMLHLLPLCANNEEYF